jgi:hypothetical protein
MAQAEFLAEDIVVVGVSSPSWIERFDFVVLNGCLELDLALV